MCARAGFVLFVISSVVIPHAARALPKKFSKNKAPDPRLACRLMMLSRFLVAIIVPAIAVYLMDTNCRAGWLRLWTGPDNDMCAMCGVVACLPILSRSQLFPIYSPDYLPRVRQAVPTKRPGLTSTPNWYRLFSRSSAQ